MNRMQTILTISSGKGLRILNDRRPDSRWATLIPPRLAISSANKVEAVSPWMTQIPGPSLNNSVFNRTLPNTAREISFPLSRALGFDSTGRLLLQAAYTVGGDKPDLLHMPQPHPVPGTIEQSGTASTGVRSRTVGLKRVFKRPVRFDRQGK